MIKKDIELIERGLSLIETYLKSRTISKISFSIITAGISILGFNNFLPYLLLTIRPELIDKIDLNNKGFMIIGISLIALGSLLPIFILIFNYYKELYSLDLVKVNKIYSLYDFDSFVDDMSHITTNMSMFDFQISRIEELYMTILTTDFSFYDKKLNDLVKKFGNELYSFSNKMSMRVSPSNTHSSLYNVPRNLYTPAQLQNLNDLIAEDCNKVINTYRELKGELDKLNNKNFYRFFI